MEESQNLIVSSESIRLAFFDPPISGIVVGRISRNTTVLVRVTDYSKSVTLSTYTLRAKVTISF